MPALCVCECCLTLRTSAITHLSIPSLRPYSSRVVCVHCPQTFENLILNRLDLREFGARLLDDDVDLEDYFD